MDNKKINENCDNNLYEANVENASQLDKPTENDTPEIVSEPLDKKSQKILNKIQKQENKGKARYKKTKKEHIDPFAVDDSVPLEKRSFARGINFYKLFWIFFIGSFIGVVIEIIFCILVTEHHYECRQGLIYGPFNPVYGFGAVAMTLALYYFRNKRDLWIFVGGSVVGASFEYLCSWFQETFLGTVSWDYSDMIGNIGGRTCLFYAVIWGFLALAWLKLIYPFISKLIEKIPNKIGVVLSWILVVFMILDCLISALAVYRMTQRHEGQQATTAYEEFMDKHYPDSFLYEIYPNMLDTSPDSSISDEQKAKSITDQ